MFMKLRRRLFWWLKNAADSEPNQDWPGNEKKATGRGSRVTRLPILKKDRDEELSIDSAGIHFKVIPASGGIAVEVQQYDERADTTVCKLHIIPDGDDIGEALAKIITLEAMRR